MENFTAKELIWTLSLSVVSYFGSYDGALLSSYYNDEKYVTAEDIEDTVLCGFYKSDKLPVKRKDVFLEKKMETNKYTSFHEIMSIVTNPRSQKILAVNREWMNVFLSEQVNSKQLSRNEKKRWAFMNSYAMNWTKDTYYAYNLANAIAFCRIAYFEDIISKQEVLRYLQRISMLVKHNFSSYDDFGKKAMFAYTYDYLTIDTKKDNSWNRYSKHRLSHGVYGMWDKIPWGGVQ